METVYALVDRQNFYVSCERVFAPTLRERPGSVLANNDGCVMARSEELKAEGVPMGTPYLEWEETLDDVNAAVSPIHDAMGRAAGRDGVTIERLRQPLNEQKTLIDRPARAAYFGLNDENSFCTIEYPRFACRRHLFQN